MSCLGALRSASAACLATRFRALARLMPFFVAAPCRLLHAFCSASAPMGRGRERFARLATPTGRQEWQISTRVASGTPVPLGWAKIA